jgi:hypothetical protein
MFSLGMQYILAKEGKVEGIVKDGVNINHMITLE